MIEKRCLRVLAHPKAANHNRLTRSPSWLNGIISHAPAWVKAKPANPIAIFPTPGTLKCIPGNITNPSIPSASIASSNPGHPCPGCMLKAIGLRKLALMSARPCRWRSGRAALSYLRLLILPGFDGISLRSPLCRAADGIVCLLSRSTWL